MGIQTLMAQGRSTKIIRMTEWIRNSRLPIANSLCRCGYGWTSSRSTSGMARVPLSSSMASAFGPAPLSFGARLFLSCTGPLCIMHMHSLYHAQALLTSFTGPLCIMQRPFLAKLLPRIESASIFFDLVLCLTQSHTGFHESIQDMSISPPNLIQSGRLDGVTATLGQ